MLKRTVIAAVMTLAMGAAAAAGDWVLDGNASHLAYGSIKIGSFAEVNTFKTLTGGVSSDGNVTVDIDLASVDTNIAIRNERMLEFVFNNVPSATLSAKVDMATLEGLAVGATETIEIDGTLSFLGKTIPIRTGMFVARLGEDKVMVSTNDMVFVSVDALGISKGIDKLQELAQLPDITRVAPVTMRLIFSAAQ